VNTAQRAKERAQEQFRTVYPALRALDIPKRLRSIGGWIWAMATVGSRTVFVPFDAAGALCPLGDLFNYAPPPRPEPLEIDGRPLFPELTGTEDTEDPAPSPQVTPS
jgi:histone-lysine N-methyltransferase SETD3